MPPHPPLFSLSLAPSASAVKISHFVQPSPPGFSQPPGFSHKVCRLCRALYGLKQAPRAWFAKFSSTISQHDDMIITGDDVQGIQDLKRFLGQHFEMKDLGPFSYFLGLEVSSSSDGYYLTQAKYTSDLISRAGITDSKIVDTPIEYNNCLNTHDGEPLPDATLYRQLVGSLVYFTITRLTSPMPFTLLASSWLHRGLSIMLLLILMPTGQGTLLTVVPLQGIVFFLVTPSSLGAARNNLLLLVLVLEAEYRAFADTTVELLWLRWLLQGP
uniref:Reverse transcriptase Ty1/copia-type domain-containing protein n=1 Tax=Fagus sylvatica TaxID=28930 RepID=A0A2N9GRX6_FAGSY